jgi:di/tricarboxylate transporter
MKRNRLIRVFWLPAIVDAVKVILRKDLGLTMSTACVLVVPNVPAALIACLLMGALRCIDFGSLFIITALLGLFISNTATAVLMAPVALAVAKELRASPYPFAMIVALAASAAFMTPISSPVNTLVVGPGNYTFGDFVKVGVPFTLVVMVVCVMLVPILLPLYK